MVNLSTALQNSTFFVAMLFVFVPKSSKTINAKSWSRLEKAITCFRSMFVLEMFVLRIARKVCATGTSKLKRSLDILRI